MHPRFALPLALPLSRKHRPHHKAHQRGGPQHEEADNHGKSINERLALVDITTRCRGYDMPRKEPDQERFERIAAAYLAEAEVEGLTSIRYDIVASW